MPRTSKRKRALKRAERRLRSLLRIKLMDSEWEGQKSDSDESDDSFLLLLHESANRIKRNRYYQRHSYRSHKRANARYNDDLESGEEEDSHGEENVPWLNDDEFLAKYRMSRDAFKELLHVIKDDPIFMKRRRGRHQRPVAYQLMTTLKAFGSEGTASSTPNLRDVFATGKGTNHNYIRRVVKALRNKRDKYVWWPNPQEHRQISRRMKDLCGLPNCVGIIDGTLFPLAFRPQTDDAPDYKGRKHLYTISSVIVCDDQRYIRHYVAGWPGSTHDNRIARNTKMWQQTDEFFGKHEYIMGDSAFENHWFMVSAFTAPPGEQSDPDHAAFNSLLLRARVISEHTIGILKGRFPWLRSIQKTITDDPKSLSEILEYMDACVIIHNFLMARDESEIQDDWLEDDDATDVDEYDRIPDEDELNAEVPQGAPGDFRRTQLLYYLQEEGLV